MKMWQFELPHFQLPQFFNAWKNKKLLVREDARQSVGNGKNSIVA